MLRVLMINSVCGIRSTGRICTDLAEALGAAGHTVKIAYGRYGVPEKYRDIAVRVGNDTDVRLHALYARLNKLPDTGLVEGLERVSRDNLLCNIVLNDFVDIIA